MPISLAESQAVNDLADILYDFLPNKPHPYANQAVSVQRVAQDLGLSRFYTGGSKRTAIAYLIEQTLTHQRQLFSPLMIELVKRGITYRNGKGNPLHREDIESLNGVIQRIGFKIRELWDPQFLDSLPRRAPAPPEPRDSTQKLQHLQSALIALGELNPQERGLAFEAFLKELFLVTGLDPKPSFRRVGEQIDGSFVLEGETYLVEAKWHSQQIGPADLRVFRDKVESKSTWTRGVLFSWSGFTSDALEVFAKGKPTSVVGFTGQDLYYVLSAQMPLASAIRKKVRHAAETGEFLISVQILLMQ